MNKWLYHQNGFTKTSLSATVTRVSNFVEEIVFLLYIVDAPPRGYSHFLDIRRLGPSIYRSPPKNIRNFKHPKKNEVGVAQKISLFLYIYIKKIP